jgi:hypothetical protein
VPDRILREVELMRNRYPDLHYEASGYWIRLPSFKLPTGWGSEDIALAFQFPAAGYPQNPFYGFYAPSGIRYRNEKPLNFTDPAPGRPPFPGAWAFFSGNPDPWSPASEIACGSNALSWLHSIYERFTQGVGND